MMMVVVVITIVMRMGMPGGAIMLLVLVQQPGADQVDGEAERGERDRFVEGDRYRVDQPLDALIADEERDHRQDDGAGERGQIAEFAGAEGKPLIAGMAPGIGIS